MPPEAEKDGGNNGGRQLFSSRRRPGNFDNCRQHRQPTAAKASRHHTSSAENIPKYYYGHFQRIAELCRYFNFHIDATQKHLSSRVIGGDIKKRDMDALVSMNWLVASEIMKTINFICPNEEYGNRDLVREQFIKVTGHFCPDIASFQDIDHLPYINKHNVKFLTILFEDRQEDYDATLKALNAAIKWHLGNRPDGYPRIGLIPIR